MDQKQKIAEDMKLAMKTGDKVRLETLRSLKAALMEKEIEARGSGKTMSDSDAIGVMMSMAKKRRESIDLFNKGNRPELAEQEQRELDIIQEYLPQMMTPDEIAEVIERIVQLTDARSPADFSKVMPAVMKEVKGRSDGKVVQELVRKRLGGAVSGG